MKLLLPVQHTQKSLLDKCILTLGIEHKNLLWTTVRVPDTALASHTCSTILKPDKAATWSTGEVTHLYTIK